MIALGLLLLGACDEPVDVILETCSVDAALSSTEGAPGDEIVISGGPFSAGYDTTVRVGGVPADVLSVDREECALCDECVASAGCNPCGTCSDCAELCDLCVETTTFAVPDVAAGPTTVVLVNLWGSTEALPFTVLGGGDTDDTDPGDTDTGIPDTDTGAPDTDTGTPADTDTGTPADTDTAIADTDTGGGGGGGGKPGSARRARLGFTPLVDLGVCPGA